MNERVTTTSRPGWILYHPCEHDPNFQVVPIDDKRAHEVHGASCWCERKIKFENGKRIVVHAAKDGRP